MLDDRTRTRGARIDALIIEASRLYQLALKSARRGDYPQARLCRSAADTKAATAAALLKYQRAERRL